MGNVATFYFENDGLPSLDRYIFIKISYCVLWKEKYLFKKEEEEEKISHSSRSLFVNVSRSFFCVCWKKSFFLILCVCDPIRRAHGSQEKKEVIWIRHRDQVSPFSAHLVSPFCPPYSNTFKKRTDPPKKNIKRTNDSVMNVVTKNVCVFWVSYCLF